MAVCSVGIKVLVGEKEVRGVTDIPALGATPEKIDVTTLADKSRKYIDGIKDYGDLEFAVLYDPSIDGEEASDSINYKELRSMEVAGEEQTIKVVLPKMGENAEESFTFKGRIAVAMGEAAVNAALTFTMSVALSTEITFSGDAGQEA